MFSGMSFLAWSVAKDIKPRYREAVEESVVDTAFLLAALITQSAGQSSDQLSGESNSEPLIELGELTDVISIALSTKPNAYIYGRKKTDVDLRIYVTDARGIVLYNSWDGSEVGKDYSKWNDVLLTLQGKYGARATRDNEEDPNSSVLYSAAPILSGGERIGVVSVGKPVRLINQFMAQAKKRLLLLAVAIFLLSSVFAFLVLNWIGQPMSRLLSYVRDVRDSKKVVLPSLGNNEISELGVALEEMRKQLEGRNYVENYVQTLTHEIKSPLSVIKGAGELLAEKELDESGLRFVENIVQESQRIENLVNRLLDLSSLESRNAELDLEELQLFVLLEHELSQIRPSIERKHLQVSIDARTEGAQFYGERFSLELALRNILQNAVEFCPKGGEILIELFESESNLGVSVLDNGPGAPDWAYPRLSEKFFSLPRAETGRKSSGLGLSIVKRIAELHEGELKLERSRLGGLSVTLLFPLKKSEKAA
jgi:two-component system sensor histidine kinase CreC